MHIFFAGSEVSDHRRRLLEAGVEHVALSFWNLKKRASANWSIHEHFPAGVQVFVDAGAYAAGEKESSWTEEDWLAFGEEYVGFVEANLDSIAFAAEFDSPVLGRDYVEQMRADFWDDIDPRKFMPVWHPENGGLDALAELAHEYPRVGLGGLTLDDKRVVANRLNALVRSHSTKLHGIGVTKPDVMEAIRFDSVSSTSWVTPMRYGEVIVWQGNRLRRYPVKYRDTAIRRHRSLMVKLGLDPEAIANGDPDQVCALSLWSWLQYEAWLTRRYPAPGRTLLTDSTTDDLVPEPVEDDEIEQVAATWAEVTNELEVGTTPNTPATSPSEMRHEIAPYVEKAVLPVMGFDRVLVHNDQGEQVGDSLVVRSSPASLRKCDSCYVASNCPVMEPGASCKFEFPVQFRDRDQLIAGLQTVLETQMQRVAFARFAEELEGGYPDSNVSAELDRFMKMMLTLKEITDNRDVLKVEVKTKAAAGVLSAIFGRQNVPEPDNAIDHTKAEQVMAEAMEVLDAEVVEEL